MAKPQWQTTLEQSFRYLEMTGRKKILKHQFPGESGQKNFANAKWKYKCSLKYLVLHNLNICIAPLYYMKDHWDCSFDYEVVASATSYFNYFKYLQSKIIFSIQPTLYSLYFKPKSVATLLSTVPLKLLLVPIGRTSAATAVASFSLWKELRETSKKLPITNYTIWLWLAKTRWNFTTQLNWLHWCTTLKKEDYKKKSSL